MEKNPVGDMQLGKLQALPSDAMPITQWDDADAAFLDIVEGLYQKNQQLHYTKGLSAEVEVNYPLSQQSINRLKAIQQELELDDEDIQRIEQIILEPAEGKYQQQQKEQAEVEAERRRCEEEVRQKLKTERRRKAAVEKRREAKEEDRRKAEEHYQLGISQQQQGNYRQAVFDLTQAKQYGHPNAKRALAVLSDNLCSERGIDYGKLRNFLLTKKWKDADRETYRLMDQILNKDWSEQAIMKFPRTDLLIIDRLWVKSSRGRYGFSVQKEIYLSSVGLANRTDDYWSWERFSEKVKWKVANYWVYYSDLKFDGSGPRGHLPWGTFSVGALYRWEVYRVHLFLFSHPDL